MLLVTVVIPPVGEFPTCDDGVFAATARDFAQTGTMHISDLPSMSLVTHAAWGAAFLRGLSDSWWSLRVSTMVMAWIGGWALYRLTWDVQQRTDVAALAAASYVFCPLIFATQYTFMTDITGSSLMLLFLSCVPSVLRSRSLLSWYGLGILGGLTYLARQTAAIPVIMLGLVLTVEFLRGKRQLREALAFGAPILLMVAAFMVWLRQVNGVPSVYGSLVFDWAIFTDIKGLVSKCWGLALETALMIGPIIVLSCHRAPWGKTFFTRHKVVTIALVLAYVSLTAFYSSELRPCRGYDVYDMGLGFPPTHEGLETAFRSPTAFGEITWFHLFMLLPAAGLLALLICVVFSDAKSFLSGGDDSALQLTRLVLLLSILGYCGMLVLIRFLFDRYLILLISLILAALAVMPARCATRRANWVSWGMMGILIVACVISTQDALGMRRTYWEAVARLHASGVAANDLGAGTTYWQTYVYEPGLRNRPHIGKTFLADLPASQWNGFENPRTRWAVAYAPLEGYDVDERVPCVTWFRRSEVLVQRLRDR